ncbi:MAG: hypothetical protein FJZ43_00135 [Candidatus Staskawiczbacteria bacterium]|nr:hypothetical protein [Candidatus Staskawiczbacteria bacterium]
MEFSIKTQMSITDIAKLIGYSEIKFHEKGICSMLRQSGSISYPKFHLYGERKNGSILFRLHIDQKETLRESLLDKLDIYSSNEIKVETNRIKGIIKKSINE